MAKKEKKVVLTPKESKAQEKLIKKCKKKVDFVLNSSFKPLFIRRANKINGYVKNKLATKHYDILDRYRLSHYARLSIALNENDEYIGIGYYCPKTKYHAIYTTNNEITTNCLDKASYESYYTINQLLIHLKKNLKAYKEDINDIITNN